ncbi:MAG: Gfo/Idh/MocA family oxidoreductase [Thermoanaerobaculia bacterium]|nr:Gfo/Idh/MocA family oxidoreductase [Thermoanaerobaculia bacterium]
MSKKKSTVHDTRPVGPRAPDGKPRLRVGVVGTGHMGKNHVRVLSEIPDAMLVGIYDQKPEVAAELARRFDTTSFASPEDLWQEADAVVLAVPTFAHVNLGVELLQRGLHVLVEKPIASSLEEADQLIAACGPEQILSIGHVEFYNPAVQAVLDLEVVPRFIEAQRLSPFTPRSLDVDVLLDLMIHDLQLLHAMDPSPVKEVRCTGIDVLSSKVDIASARIELESGATANITASRVSGEPVRKLRVFAHHRYFSVDYREQDVKGFGLVKKADESRVIVPEEVPVERAEPLRAELDAFVAACRGTPDVRYVDGPQGRRALETALAVRDAIGAPSNGG